jgi:hypothetical protein
MIVELILTILVAIVAADVAYSIRAEREQKKVTVEILQGMKSRLIEEERKMRMEEALINIHHQYMDGLISEELHDELRKEILQIR